MIGGTFLRREVVFWISLGCFLDRGAASTRRGALLAACVTQLCEFLAIIYPLHEIHAFPHLSGAGAQSKSRRTACKEPTIHALMRGCKTQALGIVPRVSAASAALSSELGNTSVLIKACDLSSTEGLASTHVSL